MDEGEEETERRARTETGECRENKNEWNHTDEGWENGWARVG